MNPAGTDFNAFLEATRREPVYVILGVQGSGTNLLGRLLVRVFNFSLVRDRSMIFNAAASLPDAPSEADARRAFDYICDRLFPSRFGRVFRKGVIRRNEPFAGIRDRFDAARIATPADLARFVYSYRAWRTGTTRMLVKSDDLWEHIGQIDRVIPDRRVILLTRDFRDNLVSIAGKHFGPIEPMYAAEYVRTRFAKYDREFRRAGPAGFHVRYERLLESPREVLDDFARHFELTPATPPDDVLASFRIRPNKIRRWASLPARDLAWCEAILEDYLQAYGYAPATGTRGLPGPGDRAAARARDVLRRVPQKVRNLRERLAR